MRFIRLITSIRKDLSLIFIGALFTIFLIDFVLIDIPEKFQGGYKLGQIIYKLCMSYMSAFIFYFLVVHIKQQKDKTNLYSYITNKVYLVVGDGLSIIQDLKKAANIDLEGKYPSKEELNLLCKAIDPNGKAPLLLGPIGLNYATWIQYFHYHSTRTKNAIEKVFKKMPFLDTELVNILTKIEDNPHFNSIDRLTMFKVGNKDFTAFESSMEQYFILIKQLEEHADTKLTRFR